MMLFTLKKAFFELWDHLFSILLMNLAGILLFGALLWALTALSAYPPLFIVGAGAALFAFVAYLGVVSLLVKEIADYSMPDFRRCVAYLRDVWKAVLVFCLLLVLQGIILVFVFPWYFHLGGIVGMVVMSILFWVSVFCWLASQYYFPLHSRIESAPGKIMLKSFVLLFDNTAFTCFLALGTMIMAVISGITAFLFPGIAGILLWHQEGFKLRLYKYDYLDENPGADKKHIPWDRLLVEERRRVGTRTLRQMVFPWKQ